MKGLNWFQGIIVTSSIQFGGMIGLLSQTNPFYTAVCSAICSSCAMLMYNNSKIGQKLRTDNKFLKYLWYSWRLIFTSLVLLWFLVVFTI